MILGSARLRSRSKIVASVGLASWLMLGGVVFAAPVLAGTCGQITVENGQASPGSGTPATTFTFTLSISDRTGSRPMWVRLRIAGSWTDLTTSGTDFRGGVTYTAQRKIPAGTWTYWFRVRSGKGIVCDDTSVAPATVVVTVPPTPTPKPTPTPTPRPTRTPAATAKATPRPTQRPTPRPAPTTRTTARPTAGPTPGSTVRPTASPVVSPAFVPGPPPDATPDPILGPSPSMSALPSAGPTTSPLTPTSTPTPTPTPLAVVAGPAAGAGGPGWTPDLGGLAGHATNPLIVWLVTTGGGLAMFLILVRRSKDNEPSPDRLVLAGAGSVTTDAVDHEPMPTPVTGRATMLPPAPPRVFDKPPAKGVERAKVGYRRVRISSKPDAVRSVERGRLERGDEIEILDSYEGFLEIRTPDGISGWILRHTII